MLCMCSVQCVQCVTWCSEDLLMKPLLHGSKTMEGKQKQHLAFRNINFWPGHCFFIPLLAEETLQNFLEGE